MPDIIKDFEDTRCHANQIRGRHGNSRLTAPKAIHCHGGTWQQQWQQHTPLASPHEPVQEERQLFQREGESFRQGRLPIVSQLLLSPLVICLRETSSVLNLPDTASAEEVRERYKTLSVLFHPDKQREETTKGTASKRFLEIQKAYEGISTCFAFRSSI